MKLFKSCPDCGVEKPVTEFGQNRRLHDGLQFYCKACSARRGAEVYRRKRERMGKTVRVRIDVPAGHKRCPGCAQVKPHSEWHRNVRTYDGLASRCKRCRAEESRIAHLRRTFGMTPQELVALIEAQGGTCAICDGRPEHIDHDHKTGRIRGVLCGPCNMGLGQFQDDPSRLEQAAVYLRRHRLHSLPIQVYESKIEGALIEYLGRHRSA